MVIICNGIICKDIGKEFTAGQGAGEQGPRSATGSASHRRLQIPARQARSGLLVGRRMPARANVAGLAMLCAAAREDTPGGSRLAGQAAKPAREPPLPGATGKPCMGLRILADDRLIPAGGEMR